MFTAFISDLHLGPERPAMAEAFSRFLRDEAARARDLYILGDLFEHWIGDDIIEEPFNAAIAHALRTLTDSGVSVRIMRGNRDFLLGERFARHTGATLIEDPCVIDLHGQRTLLMHGDTLCTGDLAYQRFRKRVRSPLFQRLFLALPRAARLAVARRARNLSERDKARKQLAIMDVTDAAVRQAFESGDCQLMIHGHTHRPAEHVHRIDGQDCRRIVLADWYEKGEYLRCDAHGMSRIPLS